VGQGCRKADGLDRETFIRVRLDVGRRLSRFDVKIRRNQRKKRAADWRSSRRASAPTVALHVDAEACGVPTRTLPSPPTLLGLQMHPFLATAFAFCILWIPDLGRFVVRITEYARITVALPALHRNATSVRPDAAPGVPETASASSTRRFVGAPSGLGVRSVWSSGRATPVAA
jgi:hypothetical protein